MSTRLSYASGTLNLTAFGLWLLSLIVYWLGLGFSDDFDTAVYLIWSVATLAAGVVTLVAAFSLRTRVGTFGGLGTTGLVLLGLGVVVSVLSWAIPLWMTMQGVGMLLIGVAMRSDRVGPRTAVIAYSSGMLIGTATFFVLTGLKVGTPDSYGDYPLAWVLGLSVGVVTAAAGLFGIGRWLQSAPANANMTDTLLSP